MEDTFFGMTPIKSAKDWASSVLTGNLLALLFEATIRVFLLMSTCVSVKTAIRYNRSLNLVLMVVNAVASSLFGAFSMLSKRSASCETLCCRLGIAVASIANRIKRRLSLA